jgi:hypothetical protein
MRVICAIDNENAVPKAVLSRIAVETNHSFF